MVHWWKRVAGFSPSMRSKAQKSRGTEAKQHSLTMQLSAMAPWKRAGQIQVGQGSQSSWRFISLSLYPSGSTWAGYSRRGFVPQMDPAQQFSGAAHPEQFQELSSNCSQQPWKQQPKKPSQAHPEPPSILPWGCWKQLYHHRSLRDCFLRDTTPSAPWPWDCYFYSHRTRETLFPCKSHSHVPWSDSPGSCTRITWTRALDKATMHKLQTELQRNTNWKSLETKNKHLLEGFSCLAVGFFDSVIITHHLFQRQSPAPTSKPQMRGILLPPAGGCLTGSPGSYRSSQHGAPETTPVMLNEAPQPSCSRL